MKFEISGKLVEKMETQQVSEKFRKREFVILRVEETPTWTNEDYIKFQLTQDRCDLMDAYELNEEIKVHFNIRGRKWEKDDRVSFFTNLEAWRIERAAAQMAPPPPMQQPQTVQQPAQQATPATAQAPAQDYADDLPF